MHDFILGTQLVHFDGVAILIHEIVVRIRTGIFDLEGRQWIATVLSLRDLPLLLEFRPREAEAVAARDGSCVRRLVASEAQVDRS